MSPACPITAETIDEHAARLCALLVLAPLGLALAARSPWPALFLAVDFGLRGFGARRWSPLARSAQRLTRLLALAPRPTNAGPKAFAAELGFGFSVAVALAFLLDKPTAAWTVGLLLAVCALLEGGAGFCVGCRLYQLGRHFGKRSHLSASPVRPR